jgi:hypothetical protein
MPPFASSVLPLLMLMLMAGMAAAQVASPSSSLKRQSGPYEITLRLPEGGLYARDEMEIEVHIADRTRPDPLTEFAPVIRATVHAAIDMPEMPSMPVYREQAHAEGVPGDYGVHPTFAHGGAYRLRLEIEPPPGAGHQKFDVEFSLSVADAGDGRKRKAALPPRFTIECVAMPRKPKAGEEAELRFVIRDRDRPPKAIVTGFEVVHEALFHLILVRADLSYFAHEHPLQQPDGSFVLRYRFPAGGDFRLFADVAPKGAGSQILFSKLAVAGPKDVGTAGPANQLEGLRISTETRKYPPRKSVTIGFRILDGATGAPAGDLEPYLGVAGHLLMVHEDGMTFVHSHPVNEAAARDGRIEFLARFPKPGRYRAWMQGKRAGKVFTAEFSLDAAEGSE